MKKTTIIIGTIILAILIGFILSYFFKENKKIPKIDNVSKVYYDNGNLQREVTYVNGLKNGIQLFYYENGSIMSKVNYLNGTLSGESNFYYQSGEFKESVNWVNGEEKGYSTTYNKAGKIIEYTYYNYFGELVFRVKYQEGIKINSIEGNPLIDVFSLEDDFNKMNNIYNINIVLANPYLWNSIIKIRKVDPEKEGAFITSPMPFTISGMDTTLNLKLDIDSQGILDWKIEQEFQYKGGKKIVTNYIQSYIGLNYKTDNIGKIYSIGSDSAFNYHKKWLDTDVW